MTEPAGRSRPQADPQAEDATLPGLYRAWGRGLFGTALRMLGRAEEAEDAVQDAFLAYHRQGLQLPGQEARAWLHRVVVNGCLDRLRFRKRWGQETFDDAVLLPFPSRSSRGVASLDLDRAVARLPERARLVFLLHDVEGFLHEEIAHRLGISAGTSKSQLARAREALRGWLQEERV